MKGRKREREDKSKEAEKTDGTEKREVRPHLTMAPMASASLWIASSCTLLLPMKSDALKQVLVPESEGDAADEKLAAKQTDKWTAAIAAITVETGATGIYTRSAREREKAGKDFEKHSMMHSIIVIRVDGSNYCKHKFRDATKEIDGVHGV